jgi:hypothetical protein
MKQALAKSVASNLREDNRVEEAQIDSGQKGIHVKVVPTDSLAENDLRSELHEYPVYIKLVDEL